MTRRCLKRVPKQQRYNEHNYTHAPYLPIELSIVIHIAPMSQYSMKHLYGSLVSILMDVFNHHHCSLQMSEIIYRCFQFRTPFVSKMRGDRCVTTYVQNERLQMNVLHINVPHKWLMASAFNGFNGLINSLRPRKMAAIIQRTFSNAFYWMNIFNFRLIFHWIFSLGSPWL